MKYSECSEFLVQTRQGNTFTYICQKRKKNNNFYKGVLSGCFQTIKLTITYLHPHIHKQKKLKGKIINWKKKYVFKVSFIFLTGEEVFFSEFEHLLVCIYIGIDKRFIYLYTELRMNR